MPTKLAVKFTHQLAEQLPADLVYLVMQYACKAYHPTATMIKKAIKDKHTIKDVVGFYYPILTPRPSSVLGGAYIDAVDYIEVDCAEMFKEVDNYNLAPSDWFHTLTEQYADISEEWRVKLQTHRFMIIDDELRAEGEFGRDEDDIDEPDYRRAGSRAWELYKQLTDCPTCVC